LDIIILSILSVLCGAESYDSIALFGRENFDFLKQFLGLKNGIPSHDTMNRVFQLLDPRRFERCFMSWAQGLKDENMIENVIAIDGKTARGSKDNIVLTVISWIKLRYRPGCQKLKNQTCEAVFITRLW
jgi:hypothetical protein